MLGRWFRGASSARPPGEIPAGQAVYAVGDIHGRLDLLRALNRLIRADADAAAAPRNVAVYLGDYIDRGDASVEHDAG